jgi:DNA-binding transcriptional LysR family regulator
VRHPVCYLGRHSMELRHLRYLVAVAEELHFGRAAIRLNISQPPLSQQIRQLEEELGVQLFRRTKREVQITEAGKRVIDEAYQVLGRISHFAKVAAQAGSGEIGHLSVGVAGGLNEVLVAALRELAGKYPGVQIELRYMNTGDQVDALREGRIDVGFLNLPVKEPALTLEIIKKEPLWLALPKDNPLARRRTIPIPLIVNQPMIFFPRRVTPGLHDVITSMCRNAGFSLHVIHESDSIVGALTLVSAGLGVAFSTPSVQQFWPDIVFRPIENSPDVEQAVSYRRESQSPALATFLGIVKQTLRKRRTQVQPSSKP